MVLMGVNMVEGVEDINLEAEVVPMEVMVENILQMALMVPIL